MTLFYLNFPCFRSSFYAKNKLLVSAAANILVEVMGKFDVTDNAPVKSSFISALCTQFQLFVLSREQYVDNVVPTEYLNHTRPDNAVQDNFVSIMERDNLLSDLKNLHAVLPLINTLAEFLFTKDLTASGNFPKKFFEDMTGVIDLIETMIFTNPKALEAIREFKVRQTAFVDFLENVSYLRKDTYVIECMTGTGDRGRDYIDYVKTAIKEKQEAYHLSVDGLYKIEDELRDSANALYPSDKGMQR